VHWHGIRIENAMDGAAPLTQAPVPPGDTFDYDFVAPDPGTYWYHSHNRSTEQVARGLAGPLIVDDREPWLGEPGAATRELVLILDDWLLDSDARIIENRWEDLHAA
jgi:FtsP/CotA-like multicopper oxidase with cupredoxin domain